MRDGKGCLRETPRLRRRAPRAGPPLRQCVRTAGRADTSRGRPQRPVAWRARGSRRGAGKRARPGRERLVPPSADGPGSVSRVPTLPSILQVFLAARRMKSELRCPLPLQLRLGPPPNPRLPVSLFGLSLQSAAGEPQLPGPRPCDHLCPKPATQNPSPGNRRRWLRLPRRCLEQRRPTAVARPWPPPTCGWLLRLPSVLGPVFVKFPFLLNNCVLFLSADYALCIQCLVSKTPVSILQTRKLSLRSAVI